MRTVRKSTQFRTADTTWEKERKLQDLASVGPAIRRQLALLKVHSVAELAQRDPEDLYRELCRRTRKRQDICVLDVYRAAVAQARNPFLPPEQCVWWYWSRLRKKKGTFRFSDC